MKEDSKLIGPLISRSDGSLKIRLLDIKKPVPPWELSHSL